MATPQSAQSFVAYYSSLLILQYLNKLKAPATIGTLVAPVLMPQTSIESITFSAAPASGTFILNYNGLPTAVINWNDSAVTIQGKLQAVAGLGSVTVTGSIASLTLAVTFTGVIPPAAILTITNNTLNGGITLSVLSTDITLPLAVQNAFNLTGPSPAVGAQLDILGKYAGVTRTGYGFNGSPITLDDADFLTLIQMAIAKNNAGSSLSVIQAIIAQFFPGEMLVFDYTNMRMSYLINSSIGSANLVQLFVTEGLLPKPMAVQLSTTIYAPVINSFFGFRTYLLPAFNSKPFNDYASYQTNWPWLSYQNAI